MRRLTPYLLLLVLWLALPLPCPAFLDRDVKVHTMEDGLANNIVYSLWEDEYGFLWAGTDGCISLYDGSRFQNFYLPSAAPVTQISRLSESCLAVICDGRLLAFDRLTRRFVPLNQEHPFRWEKYIGQDGGKCLALSPEGVIELSVKELPSGEYTLAGTRDLYSKKSGSPLLNACLSEDGVNLYVIDSEWNLTILSLLSGEIVKEVSLPGLSGASVTQVKEFGGLVWISSLVGGILCYNPASGTVESFTYQASRPDKRISHTDVYDITRVDGNRLLAVTWDGYTVITSRNGSFSDAVTTCYDNTRLSPLKVEIRMIRALVDHRGIIWIGTYGGGLICSDLRQQYFHQWLQETHNEIRGITADEKGHLLLSTFHRGILRSDKPFDASEPLSFHPAGLPETTLCLTADGEGRVWFGCPDGSLSAVQEGKVQKHSLPGLSSPVRCLLPAGPRRLFVGTDEGLFRYNSESKEFLPVQSDTLIPPPPVLSLQRGPDGTVWVGARNGLYRLSGNRLLRVESASYPVQTVLATSDGRLYVGTPSGLQVLDRNTEELLATYTSQDGLPGNRVHCLTEDASGQVWVGTSSALARLDREKGLFFNYYISGNNRAVYCLDGSLIWGNNLGLTYFNPTLLSGSASAGEAMITGIEIGNREVGIGEQINGQVVLDKDLFFVKKLTLKASNRDFALSFGDLSFPSHPPKYRYRLLPYQSEWILSERSGNVSYAHLPKGRYQFQLESLTPGSESGSLRTLEIEILPRFWETWWFRLLGALLLMLAAGFFVLRMMARQRRREREMQLEQEVRVAQIERDKEKEIRLERESFFAAASHELKTPLTLVSGPLHEALSSIQAGNPLYEKLQMASRNAASLGSLIDRLLQIEKMESGLAKLRLDHADLSALANRTAASFTTLAQKGGYIYEIDIPQSPLYLWMDSGRVASALENLLSNAFKYTPAGGHVYFGICPAELDSDPYARIVVRDNGQGMDEELKAHVFESYVTGPGKPGFSSQTGLGLRIVKNIVDLHHGILHLDSKTGEGSTFTLLLPAHSGHFAPQESSLPAASAGKRLLIVEDNEDMRTYIKSLFAGQYDTYEAADGEEGVRLALEKLPDIVICDWMMPGKDGIACSREIKSNPSTAHIPILMLTAKSGDEDMIRSLNAGVDDFMMKPFNPEVLRNRADHLIQQHARLKQLYTKALMLKQEAGDSNGFMSRVVRVVEAGISDQEFNVQKLASGMNMSQPTLYRRLKQYTDLSAIEIIRSIRMSKAASLLTEERFSLQEIAEMVGYTDIRTLSKHFAAQFGVSPAKYMKN